MCKFHNAYQAEAYNEWYNVCIIHGAGILHRDMHTQQAQASAALELQQEQARSQQTKAQIQLMKNRSNADR